MPEQKQEESCWDTWVKLLVFIEECKAEMYRLNDDPAATKDHRDRSVDRVARLHTTLEKVETHLFTDPDHAHL